jgi:hypothetical protein
MKLNEAEEIANFYLIGDSENPDFLSNITNWKDAEEQLKEVCRILDDSSLIEKVNQFINKGRAFFNKFPANKTGIN